MMERIQAELQAIEEQETVRILYAVESGSRAWGFASPDSDYDVRFLYVRGLTDYLKLESVRDVIEWRLDETLDINGWDVQKALRLLHGSNPTLFEWANSPIVYAATPEWQQLRPVIDAYFSPRAVAHHYVNTAVHNYRGYLLDDLVPLKKYLYVIRPILACQWVLDRHTAPPMRFAELADAALDPAIRPAIADLLERKIQTPETKLVPRIDQLNAYIETKLAQLRAQIDGLDRPEHRGYAELDRVFQALLFRGQETSKNSLKAN